MTVPNRLANQGEELVIHRFPTGSLGFASPADLCTGKQPQTKLEGVWSMLRKLLNPLPKAEAVPAVCIPPGARLMLRDIPTRVQREFGIGATEEVTVTQLSASEYAYRDAIRFKNGREVLLQKLCEGWRAKVLDLSVAEAFELPQARSESMFHYS
jgi:hypothetical protein